MSRTSTRPLGQWSHWLSPENSGVAGGSVDLPVGGVASKWSWSAENPLVILIRSESAKPILVPVFPSAGFSPGADCGHSHAYEDGSVWVCGVCHVSGMDGHKIMTRSYVSDPQPETKRKPHRPRNQDSRTRREKRLLGDEALGLTPESEHAHVAMPLG